MTVAERSGTGGERAIEEAMRLLDELRADLDVALANKNTELAAALVGEIKLAAVTLDELVTDHLESKQAPQTSAEIVKPERWS